jgi:hypothetical protein
MNAFHTWHRSGKSRPFPLPQLSCRTLLGATEESTAPWTVRRIAFEDFVENPGIVGVEIICQLSVARLFGDVFNPNPVHHSSQFSAIDL